MIRSCTKGFAQVEHLAAVALVAVVGLGGMYGLGGAMDESIAGGAASRGLTPQGMVASAQAGEGDSGASTTAGAASEGTALTEEEIQAFQQGVDTLRYALIHGDGATYHELYPKFSEAFGEEGGPTALAYADAMAAQAGAAFYDSPSLKGLSTEEIADLYQHAYDAAGPLTAERTLADLSEKRRTEVNKVLETRFNATDWSALERQAKTGDNGRGFLGSIGHFISSGWNHHSQKRTGNIFSRVADNILDVGLDVVGTLNVIPSGFRAFWDGSGLDSLIGEETGALEEITQNRKPLIDKSVSPEQTAASMLLTHLSTSGLLSEEEVVALSNKIADGKSVSFGDPVRDFQAALLAYMIAENDKNIAASQCTGLCGLFDKLPLLNTPSDQASEAVDKAEKKLAAANENLATAELSDPRLQLLIAARAQNTEQAQDAVVLGLMDDLLGDKYVAELVYLKPGLSDTLGYFTGRSVMETVASQTPNDAPATTEPATAE